MIVLDMPWTTPPLRSNDRLHHMARARVVRSIRDATALMVRGWGDPPIDRPVIVTLVWEVADRRVRDVGASAPTLKACLDELVAKRVLAADRHSVVTEERYRIEVGTRKGVRVEIADAEMPIYRAVGHLQATNPHPLGRSPRPRPNGARTGQETL
jgi:hypothetical protein